ncbi:hypothetical protein WJX74_009937 [Apatococcus lobatus]|uniref:Histone chaperone domain-containing protein n=2 Tax=Apatococcus TaxID=904362 RepID=A0AAW1TB82_9CHLO
MSSGLESEAAKSSKDKGKGKLIETPPPAEDEEDEEDEEFVEDEDSGGSDLGPSEDNGAANSAEDSEGEEAEPASKRAKTGEAAGPSTSKKLREKGSDQNKGGGDSDEEEVSEPEIEKNASGDELDTSNIIPGGRRSRRGRAGGGGPGVSYTAEQKVDSDEDSW